ISAMPAMSISPVKSGVGGIGTRKRFSAISSLVASVTVQAPLAMRRKVVPRSSTRKPGARACVERLSVWSRFSMGLSQKDDGLLREWLVFDRKSRRKKGVMLPPKRGRNEAGQRPQRQRRALSDPWGVYHLARRKARGRGGGGDHQRRRLFWQRRMRPLSPLWRERGRRRQGDRGLGARPGR